MSWTEINQEQNTAQQAKMAVTISHTAAGKRFRSRMKIVIRSALIGPEASWIKPGAYFRLMIGSGEHAGLLRIEPAKIGRMFGKTPGNAAAHATLTIQAQDWLPKDTRKSEAAEHDSGEGWVEITLPHWAMPKSGTFAPAPKAVQVDLTKRPGFSMTDDVVDPVAARRRGQAPVGGARAA